VVLLNGLSEFCDLLLQACYSIRLPFNNISEHPEAAFGEIARIISAKFKELSDKEKKKWEKKAADDKERYARDMAAYRGD
jgi:hypothetical protein